MQRKSSIIKALTDIVIQNSLKHIKLMVIMKESPPACFRIINVLQGVKNEGPVTAPLGKLSDKNEAAVLYTPNSIRRSKLVWRASADKMNLILQLITQIRHHQPANGNGLKCSRQEKNLCKSYIFNRYYWTNTVWNNRAWLPCTGKMSY